MRWHLARSAIPVIEVDPERTWVWSDLHLSDDSVVITGQRTSARGRTRLANGPNPSRFGAQHGVASRLASAGWTRPRHLPEDPLLAGDACRFVRRVVALKMPTVVHPTQPLNDQAFPGVHAEHLPVERFGPTGIEHHEVAIADGRRHGITYHPGAPQSRRPRPRRKSRSGDRDEHLGRLVPHRLARPGRQPHVRGERDRHCPGSRLDGPTSFDTTGVVTHDRTAGYRRPHFRRDRITAGGSDGPYEPLRVALQVRPRTRVLVLAPVGADPPQGLRRPACADTQAEAEGVADLRRSEQVGRMPPQDGPDRVARKPRPAGSAYRRLSGLGQALADDLLEVPGFHCGINTTIPEPVHRQNPECGAGPGGGLTQCGTYATLTAAWIPPSWCGSLECSPITGESRCPPRGGSWLTMARFSPGSSLATRLRSSAPNASGGPCHTSGRPIYLGQRTSRAPYRSCTPPAAPTGASTAPRSIPKANVPVPAAKLAARRRMHSCHQPLADAPALIVITHGAPGMQPAAAPPVKATAAAANRGAAEGR